MYIIKGPIQLFFGTVKEGFTHMAWWLIIKHKRKRPSDAVFKSFHCPSIMFWRYRTSEWVCSSRLQEYTYIVCILRPFRLSNWDQWFRDSNIWYEGPTFLNEDATITDFKRYLYFTPNYFALLYLSSATWIMFFHSCLYSVKFSDSLPFFRTIRLNLDL